MLRHFTNIYFRGKSVDSLYCYVYLKKSLQYPVASIFVQYSFLKPDFPNRYFVIFVDIPFNSLAMTKQTKMFLLPA